MLGQRLGRKNSRTSVCVSSREVVGEFLFCVAPSEVRVGLGKTQFGQPVHYVGPCERFRKEKNIGMLSFNFADHPFPEGERLCVRIIYPKDSNTLLNPEIENAL